MKKIYNNKYKQIWTFLHVSFIFLIKEPINFLKMNKIISFLKNVSFFLVPMFRNAQITLRFLTLKRACIGKNPNARLKQSMNKQLIVNYLTSANWMIPFAQLTSWQNSLMLHLLSWVCSFHCLEKRTYCSVISMKKSFEILYSAIVVLLTGLRVRPFKWAVEKDIFSSTSSGVLGREIDFSLRVEGLLFFRFLRFLDCFLIGDWVGESPTTNARCPMMTCETAWKSPKTPIMMEWTNPRRNIE